MYCRNCGGEMNDNQAICLKCGVAKDMGNSYCPNCGKGVAANSAVCLGCGVALQSEKEKQNASYLGGNDKVTMALICFFLGGIGVHNFMMGESKKGIMKIAGLFLCGIGGILALIDFVKILMGTYVVDPEKLI